MKAQWQLIDIETKETITILGEPFEINLKRLAEKFADIVSKEQFKGTSKMTKFKGLLQWIKLKKL